MKTIVDFVYTNVPAYNRYYNSQGFHPTQLKSYDDINTIPLTCKSILNEFDLEDRSYRKGYFSLREK